MMHSTRAAVHNHVHEYNRVPHTTSRRSPLLLAKEQRPVQVPGPDPTPPYS